MKTFVRSGSLVLVLGLAGFLAGCASSHQQVSRRLVPARDFEIVETSSKRLLNAQEMTVLRAKVADYLDKEGITASGDYYVKVFLGADKDGAPSEWVIVRFTRDTDMRFSLLASYPASSPGYDSYASYNYYPYGYDNFGQISFRYYDDPYYGYPYYIPPVRVHNRDRDRDHDGDHDHDRNKDGGHDHDKNRHDDNNTGAIDPRRFKPSFPANQVPRMTPTRWDGNSSGQNNPPRDNNRSGDNSYPRHGSGPAGRSQAGDVSGRTYTPPIRTSSESAPRTDSYRGESTRSESFRTSSQSAPSYSAPAPAPTQSDSSSRSNQDSSARESRSGPPSWKRSE